MSPIRPTNPGSGLPPDQPPSEQGTPTNNGDVFQKAADMLDQLISETPRQTTGRGSGLPDQASFQKAARELERLSDEEFLARLTAGPHVGLGVSNLHDERPLGYVEPNVDIHIANQKVTFNPDTNTLEGPGWFDPEPGNNMNVQDFRFLSGKGMPRLDRTGQPTTEPRGDTPTSMRLHSPDTISGVPEGSNSAEDWTLTISQKGQNHRMLPDGSWFDKRYATLPDGSRINIMPYRRDPKSVRWHDANVGEIKDQDTIDALDQRERNGENTRPYQRDANNNWIDVKGQPITDQDTIDALDQWQRNMNDCHIPLFPQRPGSPPTDNSPVDESGGDGGGNAVSQDRSSLQQGQAEPQTANKTETDQKADQGSTEKDTGSQDKNFANKAYQNTSFKLASWELQNAPSNQVAKQSWSTPKNSPVDASLTISELGYDTGAGASASIKGNAVDLKAYGSAEAYLAKVEGHAGWNSPGNVVGVAVNGKAEVGARVDGTANVTVDPLHGQVDGKLEGGAFVGAKTEGDAKVDVGPAEADAKGDIGAGLGAKVDADVGFEKGKINFEFGAQAYVGVGGGGNVDFSIDVGKVGNEATALGKDAVPVAQNVTKAVGDVADNAVKDAANGWNGVTDWIQKG